MGPENWGENHENLLTFDGLKLDVPLNMVNYGHKLVVYRISRQIQMRIGLRSAHSEHDSELRSPASHCDTVTVQNRHCYRQVAIDLA